MNYGKDEPRSAANKPPSRPYTETSKGRTRQDDLKAVDINNIMKRYVKTGELPVRGRGAFFADVSAMGTFREAIHSVHAAEDAFMQLPPDVRARFNNEPADFLDFTSNPANRPELVTMGLLDAPDETTQAAAEAGDKAREQAAAAATDPAPVS